jgi:exodeoxyribonuclease VII small subunit
MSQKQPDIASLSFEQALKELEGIVKSLESGSSELERSLADYTRGTQLKEHCLKQLAEARLKVEKITTDATGALAVTSFDTESA